jgi:hypothetical protein
MNFIGLLSGILNKPGSVFCRILRQKQPTGSQDLTGLPDISKKDNRGYVADEAKLVMVWVA